MNEKLQNRLARKRRIRGRVRGSASRPRMSVYRSLTGILVQLIDDGAGKTMAAASTKEAKASKNLEGSVKLGKLIAKKARHLKIERVVFDRNAYKYHGRVRALADAAKEGGLKF